MSTVTDMLLMVTGGRDFKDENTVRVVLSCVPPGDHTLMHGACRGADLAADRVARSLGWRVRPYPADWELHGKVAGPLRNRVMVDRRPDLLIVFPGGKGTTGTVEYADSAGIRIWDPLRMFGERFAVPWIEVGHRVGLDEFVDKAVESPHVSPQALEDMVVRVAERMSEADPAWVSGVLGRLHALQQKR